MFPYKMNIQWYASDLHFRHMRVPEFRPFASTEEHDETIIENWNAIVGINDKCLLLGDLAFNVGLPLLGRLNGHKFLVMGNHEHKNVREYLHFFDDIKAYHSFKDILFSHMPVHENQLTRFKYNVHGHLHSYRLEDPRYLNISLEQTDYSPISHDEIITRLMEQQNETNVS